MTGRQCIYCTRVKPSGEFSEEHVIPQFMGGSSACKDAVTFDVCAWCNNTFGTFVDAAVAKGFFLKSIEGQTWESCFDFDPKLGNVFALTYFGLNQDLQVGDDEEVELWLGPEGGTVWHIHAKRDEDFEFFAGGDPTKRRKDKSSRVYAFFGSANPYWALSLLHSVQSHFDSEVIFMGTDSDLEAHFSPERKKGKICRKDREALAERDAIRTILDKRNLLKNHVPLDLIFDVRFLAKLAVGFGYLLFGDDHRGLAHTNNLREVAWTRRKYLDGVRHKVPMKTYFSDLKDFSLQLASVPAAFVFMTQRVDKDIALVVVLPSGRSVTVPITRYATDPHFDAVGKFPGPKVFVSFPLLKETIGAIDYLDFIAWKAKHRAHQELEDVLKRLTPRSNLPPLR